MPVTDSYIIQYLLEGTTETSQKIIWMDQEGWFSAQLRDVRVELRLAPSAQGSRWTVRFMHEGDELQVCEPPRPRFFRRDTGSEDDHLANLLRRLIRAVMDQCAQRKLHAVHNEDEVRQKIYRRLLFGNSPSTD